MASPERVVAIDWSGAKAKSGQRKHIWIADLWPERMGQPLVLESGRTRDEVADWLIEAAQQTPSMVIGIDFAFSYPAWFVREECGCGEIGEFWNLVREQGETWLAGGGRWFWGRPGVGCPPDLRAPSRRGFRRADEIPAVNRRGIQPKSPFQIGGAGSVGTGSLRGMPILLRLRAAGFRIWPFDASALATAPLVMEIYPRAFTGAVNTSSAEARAEKVGEAAARVPAAWVSGDIMRSAEASEDAFDALLSVLGMWDRRASFAALLEATDPDERLEGGIWLPVQG